MKGLFGVILYKDIPTKTLASFSNCSVFDVFTKSSILYRLEVSEYWGIDSEGKARW